VTREYNAPMTATTAESTPNTVAVRPRLDLRYDVIQSHAPQMVGSRASKADAIALGEWAAQRCAPSTLVVFGPDGATIETTKPFEGTARPRGAAGH
jgi:hypothetical protein